MIDPHSRATILIFRIGSLGDTLVAMPAFHLIREMYATCRIVLLTNSPSDGGIKAAPSYQILLGSGLVDEYIEYRHGAESLAYFASLAASIRKLRPAHGIYLMPQRTLVQRLRDAVFFAVAGLPCMRGIWPGRRGNVHMEVGGTPEQRESEASRLLRSIGFNPKDLRADLFSLNLDAREVACAEVVLKDLDPQRPFIALSVGAKVAAKDWGQDRWVEFIELLRVTSHDEALVFVGSEDEADRCQQLLALWPSGGLNLCGKLSPRQSAAVLAHSSLFVGHDSGPMHLASSAGVPCISIFAARNKPGIWFPYGNEENVFYKLVPCHDCRLNVCVEREMICIRSIRPKDVAERAQSVLRRNAPDYPRGSDAARPLGDGRSLPDVSSLSVLQRAHPAPFQDTPEKNA
jgi:heptosyltransferase-3